MDPSPTGNAELPYVVTRTHQWSRVRAGAVTLRTFSVGRRGHDPVETRSHGPLLDWPSTASAGSCMTPDVEHQATDVVVGYGFA
jgi:hypothetical protein